MSRGELPELIRGLLEPSAYPHPVDTVELVQTHISYVFLAGDFVYKVKKPVDFGFLNFTTLARRRYYCQQEVLLNRRLCPDTYLGVVRIAREEGRRAGGGPGQGAGVRGEDAPPARPAHDGPPAGRRPCLADDGGHSGPPPGRLPRSLRDGAAHRPLRRRWRSSMATGRRTSASGSPIWATPSPPSRTATCGPTCATSRSGGARCWRSASARGAIRDCHGDIRLDAVCFTDGVCIFDCIEFNRRFRYSDVAADIAFLAMDLDYHGRPDLSERLVQTYARAAGDPQVLELIDFYKCYRAAVRGKVEGFRLTQPEVRLAERRRSPAGRRVATSASPAATPLPSRRRP